MASNLNMNKRILIFSLAYHPVIGGAEVAVKEITDRTSGMDFDMVTMRFHSDHSSREKIGNVNVYRINSSKLLFPIEAYLFAKKLHTNKSYDAIWSIMAARAGAAALFFKMNFPSVKYILTLQEGDPIEYMRRRSLAAINPLFNKIFIKADIVQAISTYLAGYAAVMGYKGNVEVIPNGVDTTLFTPNNSAANEVKKKLGKREGEIFLITTSRLVKKNGIRYIIRAMALLPPHIRLLIVGEGPTQATLMKLAWDLKVERRVQFIGHVPYIDIPAYLAASDIFIRPSLAEGFGNSFIEAMASGLPVIATPVGGIVDFLYDPEKNPNEAPTGLFVEVEDPVSIREQVMRLIDNTDFKNMLVKNALKMVKERYEWDHIASEIKSRVFDKV